MKHLILKTLNVKLSFNKSIMKHTILLLLFFGGTITSFTQNFGSGVVDIDSNKYESIIIGKQEWMVQNLRVTQFNDGTPINKRSDHGQWETLAAPAWCWYENDSARYDSIHGKLYNYFTVADTNMKNICPEGWHIPSEIEWTTITNYLSSNGFDKKQGLALKSNTTWEEYNGKAGGGTDDYGFKGTAGGYRFSNGSFYYIDYNGFWWSATDNSRRYAYSRKLLAGYDLLYNIISSKSYGFSVRCIKD